jgi:hypothetical protein
MRIAATAGGHADTLRTTQTIGLFLLDKCFLAGYNSSEDESQRPSALIEVSMPALLIRFSLYLERFRNGISDPHGLRCHRWLPNGIEDAIQLKTKILEARLRVWFERYGSVQNGIIRFSYGMQEVDPQIMSEQGMLDSGPLLGLLEPEDASENEIKALGGDETEAGSYEKLGKKVRRLVEPAVKRFLSILRTTFGQYWIQLPEQWDSRKESLGSWCFSYNMKWSTDKGESWSKFVPTEISPIVIMGMEPGDHRDYMTQDAWQQLATLCEEDYEPSPAATLLAKAHQLLDQGDLRYAFIEGVSAMELAIAERLRKAHKGTTKLEKAVEPFYGLTNRAQLVAMVSQVTGVNISDIEKAIEAIDIRNKIVHESEGIEFDAKKKTCLEALIRTVNKLLPVRLRFPELVNSNAVCSAERREHIYEFRRQSSAT